MTKALNSPHRPLGQMGHHGYPKPPRGGWRAVVAIVVIVALMAWAWWSDPALPHSWYDGTCCNESDCQQTTLGEVERRDDGWYVVPTGELIPFDDKRVKQSLDPLIHRCVFKYPVPGSGGTAAKRVGDTRCLYVTPPGG